LQVGIQTMADRYTYVPHIGLFILLVWALADVTYGRLPTPVIGATAGAVLFACFTTTLLQVPLWRNNVAMWKYTVGVTEHNFGAHDQLGSAFMAEGRTDEGIAQFRTALRLEPRFAMGHFHLGLALESQQRWAEAAGSFAAAARATPGLAQAYWRLGVCLMRLGQMEAAIGPLLEFTRRVPDSAAGHYDLGRAFFNRGRNELAEREARQALRLDPGFRDARLLLGLTLAVGGKGGSRE